MQLGDRIRAVLYPLLFFGMIATLWFSAWSEAAEAQTIGLEAPDYSWYKSSALNPDPPSTTNPQNPTNRAGGQ